MKRNRSKEKCLENKIFLKKRWKWIKEKEREER
jgi:hypothetical protein